MWTNRCCDQQLWFLFPWHQGQLGRVQNQMEKDIAPYLWHDEVRTTASPAATNSRPIKEQQGPCMLLFRRRVSSISLSSLRCWRASVVTQPEQQQIPAVTTGLAHSYLPSVMFGLLRGAGATCSLFHSCQTFLSCGWETPVSASIPGFLGSGCIIFRNGCGMGWVEWMTERAGKMGGI